MPPKRKNQPRRKAPQSRPAQPKPRPRRRRQRNPGFVQSALNVAGKLLPKVLGLGSYRSSDKYKRNSFLGMGLMPPAVATSKIKSTVITHKEYITDVKASTHSNTNLVSGTNMFRFPIQPADPTTFPWLATVAQNYQEYRILGMVFEFKSTCGSAISSTNNSMGSVLMSTQYRAGAQPFLNKQQMDNEQYSSDTVPWVNACHFIECAPHESPLTTLYVRSGDTGTNESIEQFDLGTFTIATCGQQSDVAVLGELWVSYQIELLKPQLATASSADGPSILTFHMDSGLYTNASPFLGAATDPGSNIVATATANSITMAGNQFNNNSILMLVLLINGTSVTTAPPGFSVINIGPHTDINGGLSSSVAAPTFGGTSSTFSYVFFFHVVDGAKPCTFTFDATGIYPGAGHMDFFVTQINDDN